MADAELMQSVVQQLEFYFSDANLTKDRFLRQRLEESEHEAVPLDVVASFNRMKRLTEDIDLVRQAVEKSSKLQLLNDGTLIKRTDPLPEARNVDDSTIYVEHLPPKVDHDMLRGMFEPFGEVYYISLPRFPDKAVKGFAFIEFATSAQAEAAAQASVTYTDGPETHSVKILSKLAWLRLKQEYKKLQRQLADAARKGHAQQQRQAVVKAKQEKPPQVATAFQNGTVVKLSNVDPDTRKSRLKDLFMPLAQVAYVDFVVGRCTAHVRFTSPEETQKFLAGVSGLDTSSVQDADKELVASLLQDEEEIEYMGRVNRQRTSRHTGTTAPSVPTTSHATETTPAPAPTSVAKGTGEEGSEEPARNAKRKGRKANKRAKAHMRFEEKGNGGDFKQGDEQEKSGGEDNDVEGEKPGKRGAEDRAEKEGVPKRQRTKR